MYVVVYMWMYTRMYGCVGVPVMCYKTSKFPAFFTPDSGLPAPVNVRLIVQVVAILDIIILLLLLLYEFAIVFSTVEG